MLHSLHSTLRSLTICTFFSLAASATAQDPTSMVPFAPVQKGPAVAATYTHPFVPGRVLVKFVAGSIQTSDLRDLVDPKVKRSGNLGIPSIDALHAQIGAVDIGRAHIALRDRGLESRLGADRWFLVRVSTATDILALVDRYTADPSVEAACPNWRAFPTVVPNDPLYSSQWGHNNTGQMNDFCWNCGGHPAGSPVGTIGFDARAESAWARPQGYGNSSIVIGIIDSGVDLDHPDLRLVAGYDAGDDDPNPDDDSATPGHGTGCAGVAAAIADNGIGVAGVAGGCSIMPLKAADSTGVLSFSAIQNAIFFAADNGANIISMSFGSLFGNLPTDEAILYAYEQGVTLLAATGNSNSSFISYPASNPYVIGVGAASPCGDRKRSSSNGGELGPGVFADPNSYTCDGERYWGSSYGSTFRDAGSAVDVIAPTILPTTDITGASGYEPGDYGMWFNGTSCATPYAAGVCALIKSANPDWTPAQVRSRLLSSCRDVTNVESSAGWDRYAGNGLVDANAALDSLTPTLTITAPNGGETFTAETSTTITWSSIGDITTVAIGYSTNGGSTWTSIAASTPNDGSESWTLPFVNSTQARVRVFDADSTNAYDASDANFIIQIPTSCHNDVWEPAEFCGHDAYAITGSPDMNHDCMVEWLDWGLFSHDFGIIEPGRSGDFDGDNDVDIFDGAVFLGNLGDTVTPCTQGGIGEDACEGAIALSFGSDPNTIVPTLTLASPGIVLVNVVCSTWTDAKAVEYSVRITGTLGFVSFSPPAETTNSSTACSDDVNRRYTRWVFQRAGYPSGPVIVDTIVLHVTSTNPVTLELLTSVAPCTAGQRHRWTDSAFNRSIDFTSLGNAAINAPAPPPGEYTCASGMNLDLRNRVSGLLQGKTTLPAADGVEFVYRGRHTPIWHYDGPFPNYTVIDTPDTTRVRWSGHPVPQGAVAHVGAAMQGHPQLLGILWLNGNTVLGCANVLNAPGTHTRGGFVSFSGLPLCGSSTQVAGGTTLYATDLRIEWHPTEVPLEDLLGDVPRNPLRTDIVPGVWAVSSEPLDVQVPRPPAEAQQMVLVYHVADTFPAGDNYSTMFSQTPITWSDSTTTDIGVPGGLSVAGGKGLWFSRSPGPNPARGRMQFAVSVREAVQTEIIVVDVASRPVATLHHGPLGIGEHRFEWRGLSSTGKRCPSGVYWLLMRSADGSKVSRKFVLTK